MCPYSKMITTTNLINTHVSSLFYFQYHHSFQGPSSLQEMPLSFWQTAIWPFPCIRNEGSGTKNSLDLLPALLRVNCIRKISRSLQLCTNKCLFSGSESTSPEAPACPGLCVLHQLRPLSPEFSVSPSIL